MSKSSMMALAIAVCLLAGMASMGAAAPSLMGPTGLFFVPTADALDKDAYNLAFYSTDWDGWNEQTYIANMGMADGLEVGVAVFNESYWGNETIINAKYQFRGQDGHRPALAFGVVDLTNTWETTMYGVASMDLNALFLPSTLHVGVGAGELEGFFVGATVYLSPNLRGMIEYDTFDWNGGAEFDFGKGFTAKAGFVDGFDDFTWGASYNKRF